MSNKRQLFAEKVAKGETPKGTPITFLFQASKVKGNYISVNSAWKIGDLKHSSERLFGPVAQEKDVYEEIETWTDKICKQAGVRTSAWRRVK